MEEKDLKMQEELASQEELAEQGEVENTEEVSPDEQLLDADGKALLFAGGPTVDLYEQWKSQFNDEIYATEFEDDLFIWRPISRREYKQIMKIPNADSYFKEERICETVVLFPENYNFGEMSSGKAGVPTLIAEMVMEKSGFQAKTGAMRI